MEKDKNLEGTICVYGQSGIVVDDYYMIKFLLKDKEGVLHDVLFGCDSIEIENMYKETLQKGQLIKLFDYNEESEYYNKIQILEKTKE